MLAALFSDLDKGEAEVIALGREMKADLLIMDERLARKYAKRLKFTVTGTVGVLLRAKAEGHIQSVRPLLNKLKDGGFRLKDDLIEEAVKLAGEI